MSEQVCLACCLTLFQWRLPEGVGRRISHNFRNGASFFLPGNDSVCIHNFTCIPLQQGETERIWGVWFSQFTWGVRHHCSLPPIKQQQQQSNHINRQYHHNTVTQTGQTVTSPNNQPIFSTNTTSGTGSQGEFYETDFSQSKFTQF